MSKTQKIFTLNNLFPLKRTIFYRDCIEASHQTRIRSKMYTRDCIELNNQTLDQAAAHCLKAWVVPHNFHQVCFPT